MGKFSIFVENQPETVPSGVAPTVKPLKVIPKGTGATPSAKISPEFDNLLRRVVAKMSQEKGKNVSRTDASRFIYDSLMGDVDGLINFLNISNNSQLVNYLNQTKSLINSIQLDNEITNVLKDFQLDPNEVLGIFASALTGNTQDLQNIGQLLARHIPSSNVDAQEAVLQAFSAFAERRRFTTLADSIDEFLSKVQSRETNFSDKEVDAFSRLLNDPRSKQQAGEIINRWLQSQPDLKEKLDSYRRTPEAQGQTPLSTVPDSEDYLDIMSRIVKDHGKFLPPEYEDKVLMDRRGANRRLAGGMMGAAAAGTAFGGWFGNNSVSNSSRQQGFEAGRKEGFRSSHKPSFDMNGLKVSLEFDDNIANVTATIMGKPEIAMNMYHKTLNDLMGMFAKSGLVVSKPSIAMPETGVYTYTFPITDRSKFQNFKIESTYLTFKEWVARRKS